MKKKSFLVCLVMAAGFSLLYAQESECDSLLLQEVEILCVHNHVDRSCFIVQALQSMFAGLAQQGIGEPQRPLPPSALKEEK